MADHPSKLPKARNVLAIRHRSSDWGHAHLLGLPRELRDIIYELTLAEPPLYLRKHQPGCPRINILHGAETPVCKSTLEEFERGYGREQDKWKFEACEKICQGRAGLALLRVNKQVHEEAQQIFLEKNVFCFMSALAFINTCAGIPDTVPSRVRRLAILQDQTQPNEGRYQHTFLEKHVERPLWENIERFSNLVELTFPAQTSAYLYDDQIFSLRRTLRSLRVVFFSTVNWWPRVVSLSDAPTEYTYMLLSRDIGIPACWPRATCKDPVNRYSCNCYYGLFRELIALSDNFYGYSSSSSMKEEILTRRCSSAAIHFLSARPNVCAPDGAPKSMALELEDGEKQDVTFLGLPRLEESARCRLEEKADIRAKRAHLSNANRIRSQPSEASASQRAETDLGEGYPAKHAPPQPVRRKARELVSTTKAELLQQREARLRNTRGEEREEAKEDKKQERAARQREIWWQRGMRKIERKRNGRR